MKNVTLNVLLVLLHQLSVHHVILVKTELQELMHQEDKLATALQVSTQHSMDHVSNPTVMLIPSVLNANKVLNFASNVLLQRKE